MKYNEQRFLLNFPGSILVKNDDWTSEIHDKENNVLISWDVGVDEETLWAKAFSKYQDNVTRDLIITKCDCECHKPWVNMLHFMPCCNSRGEKWKVVSVR